MNHFENASNDIQILDEDASDSSESTHKCDVCELSKSTAIISLWSMRPGELPFEVLHIDLIEISDKWIFHAVCDQRELHFCMTGRDKGILARGAVSLNALATKYTKIQLSVAYIHTDQDTVIEGHHFIKWANHQGILIHMSAPYSHEQNGEEERVGGFIAAIARSLKISSGIPSNLWLELIRTAVYIANRTPKRGLNWNTPMGFIQHSLGKDSAMTLSNLRIIGCKAFAMNCRVKNNYSRWL